MNESLDVILQIPLFWRVAIAMFLIWFVYMLSSRGIFRIISLVPMLINYILVLIYRLFNNLTHLLHKAGGKAVIGIDQSTTDFFGAVYGFIRRIQITIEGCLWQYIIVYNKDYKEVKNEDGSTKYNRTTKKPFVGMTFLIAVILTVLIALPTWLKIENNENIVTAPYRKYVEVEGRILDMVFNDSSLS